MLFPALLLRIRRPFVPAGCEIRAAWRLMRLALLLARGFLIVRFLFPRWTAVRRREVKQAWSRKLAQVLGVRLPTEMPEVAPQALIVSNHISWLDIYIINALTQTHFVCKEEVRDWPLIGWLVEHSETLFIARGSRAAAARTAQTIAERLTAGERVAVFPEGTTTKGTVLLPFRSALFQAAIDAEAIVQPVALQYRDHCGKPSTAPAYEGETTFWECLRAIVLASGLNVEVRFLPPLVCDLERRDLAQLAEREIACALNLTALAGSASESSNVQAEVDTLDQAGLIQTFSK